jgi:hypothetical protein
LTDTQTYIIKKRNGICLWFWFYGNIIIKSLCKENVKECGIHHRLLAQFVEYENFRMLEQVGSEKKNT